MYRAGRTGSLFDLRRIDFGLGSLIRTMIGSRFWLRRTGAIIGISGVLIVILLVVKLSGWEIGMKV